MSEGEGERVKGARPGWIHALSFLVTAMVLVMIVLGARVTSMRAGDSDPTWSLFDFLRWFRDAKGGLAVELDHRKFGILVGLLSLCLAWLTWKCEPRRWVRRLGIAAFLLVCLQGFIGGYRVKVMSEADLQEAFLSLIGASDPETGRIVMAMVHAFTAQALFCVYVLLTLATSKAWREGTYPVAACRSPAGIRNLLCLLTAGVFLQLLFGAHVRHGEIKDGPSLYLHLGWGLSITLFSFWVSPNFKRRHREAWPVWHQLELARFLLCFQVLLGLVVWAFVLDLDSGYSPPGDVSMLFRILHLANGAMILALLVTAASRSFLALRRETSGEEAREPPPGPGGGIRP